MAAATSPAESPSSASSPPSDSTASGADRTRRGEVEFARRRSRAGSRPAGRASPRPERRWAAPRPRGCRAAVRTAWTPRARGRPGPPPRRGRAASWLVRPQLSGLYPTAPTMTNPLSVTRNVSRDL
jgi:hypothetical protein